MHHRCPFRNLAVLLFGQAAVLRSSARKQSVHSVPKADDVSGSSTQNSWSAEGESAAFRCGQWGEPAKDAISSRNSKEYSSF
jgi:hypothetical protein